MAKQGARNKMLDDWAVAAGSSLGRLVAKIDRLTARRSEISAEIQHYVSQAESALRKAASQEAGSAAPKTARKRAAKKPAARKTAAKKTSKSRKRA